MNASLACLPVSIAFLLAMNLSASAATYYVSPRGNDAASGLAPGAAWRSLARVNKALPQAGDQVLLEGGARFEGTLQLGPQNSGRKGSPLSFGSYGTGRATVIAGKNGGLEAQSCSHLQIENLIFQGEGATTNEKSGLEFSCSETLGQVEELTLRGLDVSGFGKRGLFMSGARREGKKIGYSNVLIEKCRFSANANNGCEIYGAFDAKASDYAHRDVTLRDCQFFDNLGDPAITKSHTGSGLIVGDCDGGLVQQCQAWNNGANNSNPGGGPVGIWTWDSRRVVIRECTSYGNQSQTNDGGGFDLDGGSTECVIESCISYDNFGAGYLLAQFSGARPFHDNILRGNVSINDGAGAGHGGIHFWHAGSGIKGVQVQRNTILTGAVPKAGKRRPAAVRIESPCSDLTLENNVFSVGEGLILFDVVPGCTGLEARNNLFRSPDKTEIHWMGQNFDSLQAWQRAIEK